MIKKPGTILVAILVVVATLAVATGLLEAVWPAPQASVAAQMYADPNKPLSKSLLTTLGALKNQRQKVQIVYINDALDIKAKMEKNEALYDFALQDYQVRIEQSQRAFDEWIGTKSNPGVFGTMIFGALMASLTKLHSNATMYSELEVEKIKNGIKPA